jgi:hypothetical protein
MLSRIRCPNREHQIWSVYSTQFSTPMLCPLSALWPYHTTPGWSHPQDPSARPRATRAWASTRPALQRGPRSLRSAGAPGENDREFYDGIIVGHNYPGIKTQSGSRALSHDDAGRTRIGILAHRAQPRAPHQNYHSSCPTASADSTKSFPHLSQDTIFYPSLPAAAVSSLQAHQLRSRQTGTTFSKCQHA